MILIVVRHYAISAARAESDVDRSESITHSTGRKLDFVIIGVLVVAVGVLLAANTLIKIPPIVSQTS